MTSPRLFSEYFRCSISSWDISLSTWKLLGSGPLHRSCSFSTLKYLGTKHILLQVQMRVIQKEMSGGNHCPNARRAVGVSAGRLPEHKECVAGGPSAAALPLVALYGAERDQPTGSREDLSVFSVALLLFFTPPSREDARNTSTSNVRRLMVIRL